MISPRVSVLRRGEESVRCLLPSRRVSPSRPDPVGEGDQPVAGIAKDLGIGESRPRRRMSQDGFDAGRKTVSLATSGLSRSGCGGPNPSPGLATRIKARLVD
jgi:hypothetical protein